MLFFLIFLLALTSLLYHLGKKRSIAIRGNSISLHSLPSYYGFYVAIWCGVPAFSLLALWLIGEPVIAKALVIHALPQEMREISKTSMSLLINEVRQLAADGNYASASSQVAGVAALYYHNLRTVFFAAMVVIVTILAIIGGWLGLSKISAELRARNHVEAFVRLLLIASSTIAIFTTIGIILSLVFESLRFFRLVPISNFLFGLDWNPQMAMRSDQVGSSGTFGAIPLFGGTLLITLVALVVAIPVGLFAAIYMAEYAQPRVRSIVKPIIEVLAGIPTVVYGFFAVVTVAPFLRDVGANLGVGISAESALGTGLVMGIMIIPFISSLSDDVICAVPDSLRHGSYGLGATHSETICQVVLPAALPGVVGGILLAVSRAIGETMIVVMAAGLSAHLTANPFQAVTTVTVQIVTLLVGDQEFDSPKTLSAFALGLVLFVVTLILNIVALQVVRKYREKYD